MKEKKYLVNQTFDEAIKNYIYLNQSSSNVQNHNSLLMIIKALINIYGDLDLINPYIIKDSNAVYENFAKFGYPLEEIKEFFNELLNLNNPENKVFEVEYLLKLKLIDMFLYKTKVVEVSQQEKNNFYAIIGFTENEALNYFSKSLQETKRLENTFEKDILEEAKNIELLDAESADDTEIMNGKFRTSWVSGYVSTMIILVSIALFCVIITIINFWGGN